MKPNSYSRIVLAVLSLGLTAPLTVTAQTTVFSDNFTSGSDSLNGASTPGGTPTASWTSYDIAATKAATTGPAIATGDFTLKLNSATTGGFLEAQAVFAATPITLVTVGDYINLTYTFTDTGGTILAGGTGSYLFTGLYNSGGSAPVAGSLNNSGLTANTTYTTGNAANWQGFATRVSSGGNSQIYTRPLQNGVLVTNANQDVVGNNLGAGAYSNPTGTQLAGNTTTTVSLTSGSQYTVSYTVALTAPGVLQITNELFTGADISGTVLFSAYTTNGVSGANFLTQTFDGLAIGARNSGTSLNPTMDISQITVSDSVQSAPEPSTFALLGGGAFLTLVIRCRRSRN